MKVNLQERFKNKHRLNNGTLSCFKDFEDFLRRQKDRCSLESYPIERTPMAFQKMNAEKDPIFLGFEWEIRTKDCCTPVKVIKEVMNSDLKWLLNFRYGGQPLEMTSIPATAAFHKQYMEAEFFKKDLHKMIKNPSNHDCGIHIHITKEAFTKETLGLFIAFITNPSNLTFIEDIAERQIRFNSEWNKPNHIKFHYYQSEILKGKISKFDIDFNKNLSQRKLKGDVGVYYPEGKCVAVNTTDCRNTIELRIFNSVKTQQKLFKNLEFTEALTRFVREIDSNKIYAIDFVKYVMKYKYKYPNLISDKKFATYVPSETKKAFVMKSARRRTDNV